MSTEQYTPHRTTAQSANHHSDPQPNSDMLGGAFSYFARLKSPTPDDSLTLPALRSRLGTDDALREQTVGVQKKFAALLDTVPGRDPARKDAGKAAAAAAYKAAKEGLPIARISGTFGGWDDVDLIEHSGIVCYDFDGLRGDSVTALKSKLAALPFVELVATSASAHGVYCTIALAEPFPADASEHVTAYAAGLSALSAHGVTEGVDTTASNVSRARFLAYDARVKYSAATERITWQNGADGGDRREAAPEPLISSSN